MWLLIAREQGRFVNGHVPGCIVRFSIKDTPALREYFNIHEQLPPTQRGTKPKLILRASLTFSIVWGVSWPQRSISRRLSIVRI
jgi:hypothetical protein